MQPDLLATAFLKENLHEKAVEAGAAATDELRKLATLNPGGHMPFLIASLSNLADMLLTCGKERSGGILRH